MPSRTRTLMLAAVVGATLCLDASAQNWPHWRGPRADGVSPETSLPVRWTATENVAWKAKLAGRGMSTPIVWGDRIFVTSQIGTGIVEARSARYEGPTPENDGKAVTFVVQCLARADGRVLWEHRVAAADPLPPVHVFHNLSSPSCITDGERVYAWFATGQLAALGLDGKVVWQRNLAREYAPFQVQWGHGSSPVLHKDSLILQCDHEPGGYLLSVDRRTGKTLWKTDRGKDMRSYSTPLVVEAGGRHEVVVNSNTRLDAYDADTGQHLWHTDDTCRVPVPMATFAGGIVYTSRGYNSGPYLALRPGGRGDVTRSHVLWRVATGAPYVSSLLYYQDLLYLATEVGVVRCVDPATGEALWTERIGGNFSASPVGADGKVYLLNEDGEGVVLQAGRTPKVLSRNPIGELCRASPAVSRGQIFIRSDQHLYAIGKNR